MASCWLPVFAIVVCLFGGPCMYCMIGLVGPCVVFLFFFVCLFVYVKLRLGVGNVIWGCPPIISVMVICVRLGGSVILAPVFDLLAECVTVRVTFISFRLRCLGPRLRLCGGEGVCWC